MNSYYCCLVDTVYALYGKIATNEKLIEDNCG
jgi:hypothetical protein